MRTTGTTGIVCVDLDDRERTELANLARRLAAEASDAPDSLASLTATAVQSLPSSLIRLGEQVATQRPGCSGWLIRGLPIREKELGPTPGSWRERSGQATPEECALLLVGQTMGSVFAWADQQGGATVHDIVPAAGEEESLLSSSSTKEMSLHTEDAFFAERADLILLLCLRNPSRAPTYITDIRQVTLTEDEFRLVRSHRYYFKPDDSHDGCGPKFDSCGFPVVQTDLLHDDGPSALVSGEGAEQRIRFDSDYIDAPQDKVALDAAKALDRALHRARTETLLRPGELLIIDNDRCVHGRGGFEASLDGCDRWLKRISVTTGARVRGSWDRQPIFEHS